jgi:hypothetical protein
VQNVFCPLSNFDQTQATHCAILWPSDARCSPRPPSARLITSAHRIFGGRGPLPSKDAIGLKPFSRTREIRIVPCDLCWRHLMSRNEPSGCRQFRHQLSVTKEFDCAGCRDVHVYQGPHESVLRWCLGGIRGRCAGGTMRSSYGDLASRVLCRSALKVIRRDRCRDRNARSVDLGGCRPHRSNERKAISNVDRSQSAIMRSAEYGKAPQ